jgi:hypothetical protein
MLSVTARATAVYEVEVDDGGDDADYDQIDEAVANAIAAYEGRLDRPGQPFADRDDVHDATTDLGPEYATTFEDGTQIFVRITERRLGIKGLEIES